MTPTELRDHIDMLKAAGVSGPVEIGGVKFVIPPPAQEGASTAVKRSAKAQYDLMMFAATEGIPDDVEDAS